MVQLALGFGEKYRKNSLNFSTRGICAPSPSYLQRLFPDSIFAFHKSITSTMVFFYKSFFQSPLVSFAHLHLCSLFSPPFTREGRQELPFGHPSKALFSVVQVLPLTTLPSPPDGPDGTLSASLRAGLSKLGYRREDCPMTWEAQGRFGTPNPFGTLDNSWNLCAISFNLQHTICKKG